MSRTPRPIPPIDEAVTEQMRVLVDEAWYLQKYPDVEGSGLTPLQHYILNGAIEWRDPNPFFDGAWYLEQYPDVSAAGTPPMVHYLTVGAAQLRNPHPRFDAAFYARQHPETASNPLLFHLIAGRGQGWPTENPVVLADYLPAPATRRKRPGTPGPEAAESMRFALTLAHFRRSGLPCVLMVSHPLGGGVKRHIDTLIARLHGVANVLLLEAAAWGLAVSVPAIPGHAVMTIAADRMAELADFFAAVPVSRAHVHHTMGLDRQLRGLLRRSRLKFDVTLHDYYAICPQVNLLPARDGRYCGEPGPAACNACIADRPSHGARDILSWRARHAWLFLEAERVLCPSEDARDRLLRFVPCAKAVVAPHEAVPPAGWPLPKAPKPGNGEALRVAVIGVLAAHKGAAAVTAVAEAADPATLALHVIGAAEDALPRRAAKRIQLTGAYADADLPALIARVNPHVVWFPAPWPETYSFTLSAAMADGLPIVASRIGAFPERLADRRLTWLCEPGATAKDWIATFDAVRAALQTAPKPGRLPRRPKRVDFYAGEYQSALHKQTPAPRPQDLRRPGRLSVVVIPETFMNGTPTPCAYVRLLQPLDHPAIGGAIDVVLADANSACDYLPDVIATQRHAVPDKAAAERLAAHCRQHGIALLYDLDDDLVSIPPEHPEYDDLRPKAAVVAQMLRAADAIWVSTEVLRGKMVRGGLTAAVVPNALDERIWLTAPPARKPPQLGTVRILYMGSATHDADFALVEPALGRVIEASRGWVSFDMVGVTPNPDLPAWVNRVPLPVVAAATYPGFVNWATHHRQWDNQGWDIGIAPLMDTSFNGSKSPIKTMDYAALGLPVLASDVPAFRGSLADGPGGMLVANDTASWHSALAMLTDGSRRRHALADGARAALLAEHTLASQAAARRALWHSLTSPRSARKAKAEALP
jgi:glycosyltransferase involved in cell wall biosynthesis